MKKGFTQIVVLAIIRHQNKYLFTLRNDSKSDIHNKWQIPGGGHEFGETPQDTLHREVREELGIKVTILNEEPLVMTEIRGKWQGMFLAFVCELQDENAPIILNEEASEYKWLTKDELEKLEYLPGCVELLEKVNKVFITCKYNG